MYPSLPISSTNAMRSIMQYAIQVGVSVVSTVPKCMRLVGFVFQLEPC